MAHRHAYCVMASCVLFSFVSGSHAQSRSGAAGTASEPVRVAEVAPHFYVISNPAANLVLVTRDDMSFIRQRPGSTDADAVIHFEGSGILYLGPVFTSDGYPRIDRARGGKLSTMIETVDFFVTTFAQEPGHIEPIIPRRGPIATIAQLRDYRDMLRSVHDRVQTLVKAGRPLVDVLAAKPTAEFDARWGHGAVNAEQFVKMVFEIVSQP